jgi:hypothetical protein
MVTPTDKGCQRIWILRCEEDPLMPFWKESFCKLPITRHVGNIFFNSSTMLDNKKDRSTMT